MRTENQVLLGLAVMFIGTGAVVVSAGLGFATSDATGLVLSLFFGGTVLAAIGFQTIPWNHYPSYRAR